MISIQCEFLNPNCQTGSWDPDSIFYSMCMRQSEFRVAAVFEVDFIFNPSIQHDEIFDTAQKKNYFNYGCGHNTIIDASPSKEGISDKLALLLKA
jgi:hypothetical protein